MEKKGRTNRKYSAEFKIGVILDMREHHLGYRETVRKHWLDISGRDAHNRTSSLHLWERIYLEEGADGFMTERRGRACGPGKGRPPKAPLPQSVENDLIAENQRLRMEIEYLKKLSALVLADERAKRKKQKSSQN